MIAPYPLLGLCLVAGVSLLQLPVLPPFHAVLMTMLLVSVGSLFLFLCLGRREARGSSGADFWRMVSLFATILGLIVLRVIVPASSWQDGQLPDHCQRQSVQIDGAIDGLPHLINDIGGNRYRFDVLVRSISPSHCAGPQRVRVYAQEDVVLGGDQTMGVPHQGITTLLWSEQLLPGNRLLFDARLRQPRGLVNPAAEAGEKTFLLRQVQALGSLQALHRPPESGEQELRLSARRDRIRDGISQKLQKDVPGDAGALLAALAVGDRRAMTPEIWARLRLYGLSHLLVISGMHISLVAIPGWFIGVTLSRAMGIASSRRGLVLRFLPACFAIFAALGYALLSGFGLPAQRALLMLVLVMLPGISARALPSGRVLPLAGVLLFLFNPLSLLSASFWLTLGAVALLLWFSVWRGDGAWLRDLGRSQVYMLIAMLPLSLFWFGEASSLGGLVNLLAIPLVTMAVVPLLLGSLLLEFTLGSAAELCLDMAAALLTALWSALVYWEPLFAQWGVVQGRPGAGLLLSAIVGVSVLPLPRFLYKIAITCLLIAPLLIPAYGADYDALQLVFFDVGQGTAVLVRHGDASLLYDTGGGPASGAAVAARSVLPMFRRRGIDALNTLVISHPDRDHDAGEKLILEVAEPGRIRRGVAQQKSQECRLGETQRLGDAALVRYLSQRLPGDSDNDASCVIALSAYGRTVLLAGDIGSHRERELLAYWGPSLKADVLLAGHHGSATSNSRLWLRSLAPRMMVITAGHANRFGHPSAKVLEIAAQQGLGVLNTATSGAVVIRIARDGSIFCNRLRHRWQPFWRRGIGKSDCMPSRKVIHRYNQEDI